MDISENSGIPKSSILIGFSIIHHPFWGTPIFGNTQMKIKIGYSYKPCSHAQAARPLSVASLLQLWWWCRPWWFPHTVWCGAGGVWETFTPGPRPLPKTIPGTKHAAIFGRLQFSLMKKNMFLSSSGVFCVDSEHSQLDLSEQHLRVGVLNQPGA